MCICELQYRNNDPMFQQSKKDSYFPSPPLYNYTHTTQCASEQPRQLPCLFGSWPLDWEPAEKRVLVAGLNIKKDRGCYLDERKVGKCGLKGGESTRSTPGTAPRTG
jgi:hypothetical protein